MRVLHLGEYAKGGVATYINEVLRYQRNCNEIEEVCLLVSDRSSETEFAVDGEHCYRYHSSRSPLGIVRAIFAISRLIGKLKPDIIHVHSTFAGLFLRSIYFFRPKAAKIVYCAHGWSFLMEVASWKQSIYALIERVLAIRTDLIINISKYEQKAAVARGLPQSKMVLIYNGVAERESASICPALTLDETKINLLFVGRFDRQKGLDLLLDLFEHHTFTEVQLYLIGGKVLGDADVKIPEGVINLGWVPTSEIDAYYQLFDAVIVPSRWEGFGLVVIEAMRNKKAVIASNRGALPEIVNNGETGFVFELDNLFNLAALLQDLDKRQLAAMGEAGYGFYKRNFTGDEMNQRILAAYRRLLDKKGNENIKLTIS